MNSKYDDLFKKANNKSLFLFCMRVHENYVMELFDDFFVCLKKWIAIKFYSILFKWTSMQIIPELCGRVYKTF